MAYNSPFAPQGNTISLTTSVTPSTAQSRQVLVSNFGTSLNFPSQIRVANRGTADVWISLTTATAVAAIPTPGTTTVGTPQPVFVILPGVVEVFTVPAGPTLWINDISTVASQTYHVQAGEGL